MATHSSILAWRIPWTEKPGELQSMGRKEQDTTERLTLLLLQIDFLSGSNIHSFLLPFTDRVPPASFLLARYMAALETTFPSLP